MVKNKTLIKEVFRNTMILVAQETLDTELPANASVQISNAAPRPEWSIQNYSPTTYLIGADSDPGTLRREFRDSVHMVPTSSTSHPDYPWIGYSQKFNRVVIVGNAWGIHVTFQSQLYKVREQTRVNDYQGVINA